MKIIKGLVSCIVNNKEVLLISDDYKGSPIIAHRPDMIIVSNSTFERYKEKILFREEVKIILI